MNGFINFFISRTARGMRMTLAAVLMLLLHSATMQAQTREEWKKNGGRPDVLHGQRPRTQWIL